VSTEVTVAVQVLLLSATLPAIARELHGLNLYGWVLSAGAVGVLLATPLAGAAVDRWNPVRLLQLSATLAIGGMSLSALAPAMPWWCSVASWWAAEVQRSSRFR
jgi:MFS family permease